MKGILKILLVLLLPWIVSAMVLVVVLHADKIDLLFERLMKTLFL